MYLVYPLLIFLAALEKLETEHFGNVDKKMNNETESRLENFDNEVSPGGLQLETAK